MLISKKKKVVKTAVKKAPKKVVAKKKSTPKRMKEKKRTGSVSRSAVESMKESAREALKKKKKEALKADKRLPNGRFLPGRTPNYKYLDYEFFNNGSKEFEQALTGLSRLFCSMEDAALVLGLSPAAFSKRLQREPDLRSIWDKGRAQGKVDLRMKQNKLAETSAGAAIFLGKNYLGQRDEQHIKKTEERKLKIDISKLSYSKMKTLQGLLRQVSPSKPVDAQFEIVK
jgi:hypothetical protein